MVAAQVPVGEMEDEGQIAVRTAQAFTTVAAQDEGRGASAVDEQDPLSPSWSETGHGLDQAARQDRSVATRQLRPHVDHLDVRCLAHLPFRETRLIRQSAPHAGERDQVRGGAPEDQPGASERRSTAGDPARVVARRAIGLVSPVVLLVEHDQSQVGQRCEDRGARPEHHSHLTAKDPPPRVVALARAQRGV